MERDIAHQVLVTADTLSGNDNRFLDAGLTQQGGFYFAQLNAMAANLHLVVDASKKFNRAVGMSAHQITGPVHARAGAIRNINEALGRQLRAKQIPGRYPFAANEQLAGHQRRTLTSPSRPNAKRGVGNRLAQRNEFADRSKIAGRRPHRGFSGPIHVDQVT